MNAALFDSIDLSDCIKVPDCSVEKKAINITRCNEEQLNFFVNLVKDGVVIGEMTFLDNPERQNLFIIQLRNRSIDAHTQERKYNKVGSSLIDCAKKIASAAGYDKVCVTAQTPFCTPLPRGHDIVKFYEKQGFTLDNENGSAFYGYRMTFFKKKDSSESE